MKKLRMRSHKMALKIAENIKQKCEKSPHWITIYTDYKKRLKNFSFKENLYDKSERRIEIKDISNNHENGYVIIKIFTGGCKLELFLFYINI